MHIPPTFRCANQWLLLLGVAIVSVGCDANPPRGTSSGAGGASSESAATSSSSSSGAGGNAGGTVASSSSSSSSGMGGTGGMGTGGMSTGGAGGSGGATCMGSEVDCSGTCVDLGNHAENCGACGHSCLGGACNGGLCAAADVIAMNAALLVKVDATTIFYTAPYDIYALPKAGGMPSKINQQVGANAYGANSIALDNANVFWSCGYSPSTGLVLEASKSGFGQTILYDQLGGMGKPLPLVPGDLDANGTAKAVYWCAAGDGMGSAYVVKTSIGFQGGTSKVIGTMPAKFCRGITLDATHAYTTGVDTGAIYTTPLAGTMSTVFVNGLSAPTEMVSDAENLYVLTLGTYQNNGYPDGKVVKIPLAGGAPVDLATSIPNPIGIAVDNKMVYFTSAWTANAMTADGKVLAVPAAGGPVVTIAKQESQPQAVAVDATHVYWANYGISGQGGGIRKAPK